MRKNTLNIAHRGFSGKYPENTMLAFKKAVEAKCDGIETDLNMTKDGVLVVCHDEKIDRTTDGCGYIKDYTYNELKKFDAGVKFGDEFKGEKIITIDELLDYMKDKNLLLNLELKNNLIEYEDIEKKVVQKIHEYKLQDNIIISSFNHYSIVKLKNYDSSIKTGLLYGASLYEVHEYGKKLGVYSLHPYFAAVLNREVVENIKRAGININTYTVNEEEYMRKLVDLEIDGIITNYPDKLNEVLKAVK
ncbi:glycerophosphodiester phosphodiesterase [Clostridium felsineum]|uniref:Glycerophosphodiester phosphodiesterase n=1 Tax=Clostridium felsineum TaxID=36839 RepID=A0A1S8L9W5_9CLOT|nr:glycerophosphodiester phosphodiesterase [Clostridium felsineum]URZ02229.1 Glycerophosphodiester phosphodiesterase [Clostridium felsineum]URZ05019.1 Glycerophosphodiester phosphodiesterase [Clostridium felsineum]URZ10060.1 Glycerophosphodiester phosphodiesterase [Clostridium felsineum]